MMKDNGFCSMVDIDKKWVKKARVNWYVWLGKVWMLRLGYQTLSKLVLISDSKFVFVFQAIVANIRTSALTTRTAAATASASTSKQRRRRESSASVSTGSSGQDVQKVNIINKFSIKTIH